MGAGKDVDAVDLVEGEPVEEAQQRPRSLAAGRPRPGQSLGGEGDPTGGGGRKPLDHAASCLFCCIAPIKQERREAARHEPQLNIGMLAMSAPPPVLILSRRDIAGLMRPADYLGAVERGFRAAAAGEAFAPMPMHIPARDGGFHAKGAAIGGERAYVALKLNGNFPANPAERALPTVQGALILCDAETGSPLALMDSIEVTLRRTAAASALAARWLARPESETLLICGCGEQGRAHLEALAEVLPIRRCLAWDADADRTAAYVRDMARPGLAVEAAASLAEAGPASDVVVTCTSARSPFLGPEHVRPGAFVAAVGTDSPDKSELSPELMAAAAIVTDVTAQCAEMGDLHHALAAGSVNLADVRAELAEIVARTRTGRCSAEEILVFDSTGTALQDVAAAAAIYERAAADPARLRVALGSL
jgi:alanine dehydrogenase